MCLGGKGKNKEKKCNEEKCTCPGSRIERFIQPCLLLLVGERPGSHGYELLEGLKDFCIEDYSFDTGAIYRNLRRLEEEGLVSSNWQTAGSGPAKRAYTLTARGKKVLSLWADNIEKNKGLLEYFIKRYRG